MSNEQSMFKHGEIYFQTTANFDKAEINFHIIPYGYLAQDKNDFSKVYMFETYAEMKEYFTDHTQGRLNYG